MGQPAQRWKQTALGALAEFKNGVNYTKENFGQGVKVINVKNFQDYSFAKFHDLDEINPDGVVKPSDLLREDDILFVRSNGNRELIGRSLYIKHLKEEITHSAFTIRARFISGQAIPRFYAYLFRSPLIRQTLSAFGGGTNISNLNQRILNDLPVPLPSLVEQRKIVDILSTYDDLIENNTRRIKILEEMARAIYRQWFVHFRFPGHEKVKMVDSVLGKIPDGWELKKVTEAMWINPSTKVPKDGEKPYVPMGSLSNGSMVIGEIEYRGGNNGSKFKNGDTLFARITPCLENGKTGYIQFLRSTESVGLGSTEFIVLRSKTLCPEYIYLLARSDEFRDKAIKSMSGATGRQRVQEECFEKFLFAHPDQKTLSVFTEQVSPLFHAVRVLAEKNAHLRRTRDLLLPKLIAGEIDVANLDVTSSGLNASGHLITTA